MAGADRYSPLIESRADLIEAMARGCKPESEWRIGTEHEKHVFHTNPLRPVAYEGPNGVRALLDGIQAETGWHPFYDGDNVIGLRNLEEVGGISLEPGGQFELSGAPQPDLHASAAELAEHMAVAKKVAAPLDIHFLGLGVTPLWSVADIPAMPKSRYGIMKPYMEKVGTLGTSMMFRSCTVQSNLDFSSEADMVKKLRVAVALQPIATALFANSPFVDGRDSGYLSFRSHIWLNTDAARTGMLPFAFEQGFGFEQYADYALDVPMYFVMRDGRYNDATDVTFRQFLDGAFKGRVADPEPNMGDWTNHLSTLFPDVRLKTFLEMRGADGGPWRRICALPAYWVGLLYDAEALDAAENLTRDWSFEEVSRLRAEVPTSGFATPFRGGKVLDLARESLTIARDGLKRRKRLNDEGNDESVFLAPLEEVTARGTTSAEELVRLYKSEWQEDMKRVFKHLTY